MCGQVNRTYLCGQYKLNSMFCSSHNKHILGQRTIYVKICCPCSLQVNLSRKYVCSFLVDKSSNYGFVLFQLWICSITENCFGSNIDLILRFLYGCIGYCCTAQLTIDWSGTFVSVTVALLN